MSGTDSYVITEQELAKRVGMSMARWTATAPSMERVGFPIIHPILGNRIRAAVDNWFATAQSSGGATIATRNFAPQGLDKWQRAALERQDLKSKSSAGD